MEAGSSSRSNAAVEESAASKHLQPDGAARPSFAGRNQAGAQHTRAQNSARVSLHCNRRWFNPETRTERSEDECSRRIIPSIYQTVSVRSTLKTVRFPGLPPMLSVHQY